MSRSNASAGPHPAGIILLDYLEGGLPAPVLANVRKHLGQCRDCRQSLNELCGTVEEIERLPTTFADALSATPEEPRDVRAPLLRGLRPRVVAIAALLALASGLWVVVGRFGAESGAEARASGERQLVHDVAVLGGRVVHDGAKRVVLVPQARRAEGADAVARAAKAGLTAELALYAR